ncbi:MAG: TQO small subunit DoxD [Chloroflexota bacterium]
MHRKTRRPVGAHASLPAPDTEADPKPQPDGEHTIPAVVVLPLRLFLGLTFAYAAIQKLADPGFLHPGSSTYIGAQLLAFSRGSPIRFFLLHAAEHASAVGVLTIVTELAIALCVLLGIATRPAALVGLVLNFIFFLSASWHTYPYFMGSDIVFVIAWLTLALSGPGPVSLGRLIERRILPGMRPEVRRLALGPETATTAAHPRITRREAIAGSVATALLVVLGIADHAGPVGAASGAGGSLGGKSASGPAASGQGKASSGAGTPAGMKKIGNVSQLPPNSAGTVQDPASGDPVIVVRTDRAHIYAYDAVCTHAGCTVQYDPSHKLIVCPCHGGEFDPAHGAQVVAGPPPAPLARIAFKVDSNGNIYIS